MRGKQRGEGQCMCEGRGGMCGLQMRDVSSENITYFLCKALDSFCEYDVFS